MAFNKLKNQLWTPARDEYVTAPEHVNLEPNPALADKNTDVDWDMIKEFEGGVSKEGYVPKAGNSGVTVGAGFDIGQQAHLEGLHPELKEKLKPYLGLKKQDAERKLAEDGLSLGQHEADAVTKYGQDMMNDSLKNQWKKVSDVPFDQLTPAQQTVLQSVQYQYGDLSRTPRFAQFAGKGQWEKVVKELRNFKDSYKTRRGREADYLADSLKKK